MKRIALVFISGTLLTKMFWTVLGYAEMSEAVLEPCQALDAGEGCQRALAWPRQQDLQRVAPVIGLPMSSVLEVHLG